MKRYLLTALLGAFIVVAICTYYVYGAMEKLPEYKLNTIEGSPTELDVIEINGWYGGVLHSEFLTLNTKGTVYRKDVSLYEEHVKKNFNWFYSDREYKDLKKEHRHFMRGKSSMDNFYKDEEWLIYADTITDNLLMDKQDVFLKMDLLNEKNGNVNHYRTKIAESVFFGYVAIGDVQRIGDEVHILVRISDEYRIYVLDLSNGELIRDEKLDVGAISEQPGIYVDLYAVSNEIRSKPAEHVVIRALEKEVTNESNGSYSEIIRSERVYSYAYRTGKLTALPQSAKQGEELILYDGNTLNGNIFSSIVNDRNVVTLKRYDVASQQPLPGVTELTARELDVDEIASATNRGDRIYMLLRKADISYVAVVDATNGNVLYKGKATFEGPESKSEEQMKNLHLMNIYVRS